MPAGDVVSSRDVDCEANDIFNIDIVLAAVHRVWVIGFQLGWCANRWGRASLLQISKPYPTVKLHCDSNNAARLPLYLCINTR